MGCLVNASEAMRIRNIIGISLGTVNTYYKFMEAKVNDYLNPPLLQSGSFLSCSLSFFLFFQKAFKKCEKIQSCFQHLFNIMFKCFII